MTENTANPVRRGLLTSRWAYMVYGILLASLVILGIRFATYAEPHTHFHANFAVFVDGRREEFKAPQYYEEVALCGLHAKMTPEARTHMHEQENGVIHVHHDGVTWGQFFENLGWYVGPDFIRTNEKLYTADDINKLHIMLNGQDLTGLSTITNELIDDKDRLLVSYGNIGNAELEEQFRTVPANAGEYNSRPDPASCAGPDSLSATDRLKHLF